MKNILVRQTIPRDAPAITLLSGQLGYIISLEKTLQNIDAIISNPDNSLFVAIHNGDVVGWIGVAYSLSAESAPHCEIRGLVVDENFRRKGIGNMLIERAKEWGKEKGTQELRVRCNVKRKETHLFYEHLGFSEVKQQKVYEINL